MKSVKEFTLFLLLQFVSYALVTVGFLAVAERQLAKALVVDAVYASFTYFIIRRIATGEDSASRWAGYLVGSLLGTFVGIVNG